MKISKQAIHQHLDRIMQMREQEGYLVRIINQIRREHPTMNCRYMYFKIQPSGMGRDAFELLCKELGYNIDRKINYRRTTDSTGVIRFDNLIKGLKVTRLNQVWSSDITYLEWGERFYYITFIIDHFSRRIVGHSFSVNLTTEATTLPALKYAIRTRGGKIIPGLILHSDGGGQYYDKNFLLLSRNHQIINSMCEHPWDNGMAERINGTIKNGYLMHWKAETEDELSKNVDRAVHNYNYEKPHRELKKMSPVEYEKWYLNLPLQTRPTMTESFEAKSEIFGVSSPENTLQTRPQNLDVFSSNSHLVS
jgi:transposase InsO family protein